MRPDSTLNFARARSPLASSARTKFILIVTTGLTLTLASPRLALAQSADDSKPATDAAATADKLVADLGADDYQKREEAQKKLVALGKKALPALQKAEKESKDAEVRARAHEAIAAITTDGGGAKAAPDREKKGELEPDEPKVDSGDDDEREPPSGLKPPRLDDLFRGGGNGMDGDMPDVLKKMLEQIQKQFEGMDRQFQRELHPRNERGNGGGGFRIQTIVRPRTPIEQKLGVALVPPAPALAAQLSLGPTDGGLVVDELTAGQPAWRAGLQRYDVVISIDGKPVRDPGDLAGLGERDAKVEVYRRAQKTVVLVHKTEAAPATPTDPNAETPKAETPGKSEEPARKF